MEQITVSKFTWDDPKLIGQMQYIPPVESNTPDNLKAKGIYLYLNMGIYGRIDYYPDHEQHPPQLRGKYTIEVKKRTEKGDHENVIPKGLDIKDSLTNAIRIMKYYLYIHKYEAKQNLISHNINCSRQDIY